MAENEETVLSLLKDVGLITDSDVEYARDNANASGRSTLDELLDLGLVSRLDITKALANTAGREFLDRIVGIPDEIVAGFSATLARKYRVFPLEKSDNYLRIAISDPLDFDTLDSLQFQTKCEIDPVVVPLPEIETAIIEAYGSLEEPEPPAIDPADITILGSKDKGPVTEEDNAVIKLVNSIIIEAYHKKASDIHIEPMEQRLRLRYRMDGVLEEMMDPPKHLQSTICTRLKIMSNMSIAEKRLPQDGRIQVVVGGKSIDLRVSTVPTTHGEGIVMRILDKSSLTLGLPELGFLSDDQQTMERILGLADGIFLVTGPTGSGKTTTLYSCLHYLNKSDRKIITVEDPVEYVLKGVNQVQVQADIGMTFPAALRSMLRQAPNIIMIGEIRDSETASIAINASLTGHLVFSTLHTNDAPGAISRLVDIGVKPFLVSSALRAVMAQRLIRKLCPVCKAPYDPSETELSSIGVKPSQAIGANIMRPMGCPKCNHVGYKGRAGIFEIFGVSQDIQRLINESASSTEIRARARQMGMRTLREDGVRKVLAGMTSIVEVVSATVGDKA